MFEDAKETLKDAVDDNELFALFAEGMKKMHDALIAVGFSKAEATQIVAGQGLGAGL